MSTYHEIADVNGTSSCADIMSAFLDSWILHRAADVNGTSLCDEVYGSLRTGLFHRMADVNGTSLCNSVTASLPTGVHRKLADVNGTSLCNTVSASLVISTHKKLADVNATSQCWPVTANLNSIGMQIATEVRCESSSFIRSPLIPVSLSGEARPRASGVDIRIYMIAPAYNDIVLESMTVRYNYDDKRFIRGIYASKAPAG